MNFYVYYSRSNYVNIPVSLFLIMSEHVYAKIRTLFTIKRKRFMAQKNSNELLKRENASIIFFQYSKDQIFCNKHKFLKIYREKSGTDIFFIRLHKQLAQKTRLAKLCFNNLQNKLNCILKKIRSKLTCK